MTTNTLGLAINTVYGVILEVCKAICKVLDPSFIYLPSNKDEMRHKVAEFESKFGMPQAFGCIGWDTHSIEKTESKFPGFLQLQRFLLNEHASSL